MREMFTVSLGGLPAFLPECCVENCTSIANVWHGYYITNETQKGEYSQVRGWFYCTKHVPHKTSSNRDEAPLEGATE